MRPPFFILAAKLIPEHLWFVPYPLFRVDKKLDCGGLFSEAQVRSRNFKLKKKEMWHVHDDRGSDVAVGIHAFCMVAQILLESYHPCPSSATS
jgi:hypothetical protein